MTLAITISVYVVCASDGGKKVTKGLFDCWFPEVLDLLPFDV